jgi:hypothetical protein
MYVCMYVKDGWITIRTNIYEGAKINKFLGPE